ncbi:MAG: ADP-ribosylglycohydrolase family protein [candidate division KSB1 bacterium]|nr:ADP-ribosylglycohydrolase family protein [candidate division KSB1 bacterium]
MKKQLISFLLCLLLLTTVIHAKSVTMTQNELKQKIMGGWAGQVIGCTFGGPTEFDWRSTFIHDYTPIEWNADLMEWFYDNAPGLYDDIYMDLTFVQVFEDKGLDAPAEDFAKAFANAEYPLWHANMAARYNILNGVMPPKSGHWLHNPHSEDIDYQIEADFAGLMTPGMVNTASEISDKIGHIMNYGDGWYGGVYVGAMYSLAFVSDDIDYVVNEALKTIPEQSEFYKCMQDVIKWSDQYPDNWKMTWFKTQEKWGEDIGCPNGVFNTFNIDAKINAAWILLGLLYGDGDYGKTLSISTRAGDDSDCNPASAGGILGCMIGYDNIPDYWKQGIDRVVDRDFAYTTISLNDAYDYSLKHALELIKQNGGKVKKEQVTIAVQQPKAVRLEVGFEGHYPVKRQRLNKTFMSEASFEFDGIGFACNGYVENKGEKEVVLVAEMYIDGKLVETSKLPTNYVIRKNTPFWRYQLPKGNHTVHIKLKNTNENVLVHLNDVVVYDDKPAHPKH